MTEIHPIEDPHLKDHELIKATLRRATSSSDLKMAFDAATRLMDMLREDMRRENALIQAQFDEAFARAYAAEKKL